MTTKLPNIPNEHKTFQTASKHINMFSPIQCPPEYAKIGIFGMKINHLATLVRLLKHNRNDSLRPEDKT
jgi:hypothetical protein